jgi:hypothetical protein
VLPVPGPGLRDRFQAGFKPVLAERTSETGFRPVPRPGRASETGFRPVLAESLARTDRDPVPNCSGRIPRPFGTRFWSILVRSGRIPRSSLVRSHWVSVQNRPKTSPGSPARGSEARLSNLKSNHTQTCLHLGFPYVSGWAGNRICCGPGGPGGPQNHSRR